MCGIIGFSGEREAREVILDGLGRLEIRGYDSSGIALHDGERIERTRSIGGVSALARIVPPTAACTGIGHTRWATHGRVVVENAHPFWGCTDGEVAVALNGIVENFAGLRLELEAQGHVFRSETDAEVVAHLVEEAFTGDLVAAVRASAARLEGHFAFVVLHRDLAGLVVGTRRQVPLIAGVGIRESALASSVSAFDDGIVMLQQIEDGDVVALAEGTVSIVDADGAPVTRELLPFTPSARTGGRDGYCNYLLKEIHEQPRAVAATLAGRDDPESLLPELDGDLLRRRGVNRVLVLGCGTSFNAGLSGVRLIESWSGLPARAEIASEWRYREPILEEGTLVIGITQSGETADTLGAIRLARSLGAVTLAITNTPESQITREAELTVLTNAGPEVSVAATKTFATQVVLLALLALRLGHDAGHLALDDVRELTAELAALPGRMASFLQSAHPVEEIAAEHAASRFFVFLGRDAAVSAAREGALKLREVTYIPTEIYAAGEMKHGPIALIDETTPVVCVATDGPVYDKLLSNIQEVRARGARVIAIATHGNDEIQHLVESVVYVPRSHHLLQPVLATVPLQLLASHAATALGLDCDRPRNLAKTVTVE